MILLLLVLTCKISNILKSKNVNVTVLLCNCLFKKVIRRGKKKKIKPAEGLLSETLPGVKGHVW